MQSTDTLINLVNYWTILAIFTSKTCELPCFDFDYLNKQQRSLNPYFYLYFTSKLFKTATERRLHFELYGYLQTATKRQKYTKDATRFYLNFTINHKGTPEQQFQLRHSRFHSRELFNVICDDFAQIWPWPEFF